MIDCTILRAGDGLHYAQDGERVVVHYKMSLAKTGKLVHSSFEKMKPFIFQVGVGQVIPGWDAAVKQLSKGRPVRHPGGHGVREQGGPGPHPPQRGPELRGGGHEHLGGLRLASRAPAHAIVDSIRLYGQPARYGLRKEAPAPGRTPRRGE